MQKNNSLRPAEEDNAQFSDCGPPQQINRCSVSRTRSIDSIASSGKAATTTRFPFKVTASILLANKRLYSRLCDLEFALQLFEDFDDHCHGKSRH